MRCRKCEYRLWSLTDSVCPERGTPFRPSDFEFVINSVQFCYPYCNQDYDGTSDKGHLVPSAFDCVACGQPLHMEQTEVDQNPWLVCKRRGVFKAWFAMVGRAMVSSAQLM